MNDSQPVCGSTLKARAVHVLLLVAFLCGANTAQLWAQALPDSGPFSSQPVPLAPDDSVVSFGESFDLDGNTAVVGAVGAAFVYERDATGPLANDWRHVATLRPSDPALATIVCHVAISGNTVIVFAKTVVTVFDRDQGTNLWNAVKTLTLPDLGEPYIVAAISGDTIAVGQPRVPFLQNAVGAVHVFDRNLGGPNAWGQVGTLTSPAPASPTFFQASFGASVALDHDTLIVGSPGLIAVGGGWDPSIYTRNRGGANNWGLVTVLEGSRGGPDAFNFGQEVAISGDTAVASGAEFFDAADIYYRNQGGTDAWGLVTSKPENCCGINSDVDGDIAITSSHATNRLRIFARNQGSANGWGEVAAFAFDGPSGGFGADPGIIRGDTIMQVVRSFDEGVVTSALQVFTSDVDYDGIRDGADPCPHDPLNNVAGGCRRVTSAYQVLDNLVTASGGTTSCCEGSALRVTQTFTNTSTVAIAVPFFNVSELGGGNLLANADGGAGGEGATLSIDVGDGVLSPGEQVTVTFVVNLKTRDPFRFMVRFRGQVIPNVLD